MTTTTAAAAAAAPGRRTSYAARMDGRGGGRSGVSSGAVCESCGSFGAMLCIGRLGQAATFLCGECMMEAAEAADD